MASTVAVIPGIQPVRPFGFTVIAICPLGWGLPTFEQSLERWSNLEVSLSLASTLLHEVQHADEVVGLANVCDDFTYDVHEYKMLYLPI
jgi:hypothetical protein